MFSARDPLTTSATTRFGSTFHTPTLDWSTNTVLATLSAASKTSGRARQEAIHMTTCDHSLCARKRVVHMTTRNPARPSAQRTRQSTECSKTSTHQGVRRVNSMRLAICSAALVRAFVARFSFQRVLSCLVTRPHPLTFSKIWWQHRRRRWNAWRQPTRVGIWFHNMSLLVLCRRNGFQHRWR